MPRSPERGMSHGFDRRMLVEGLAALDLTSTPEVVARLLDFARELERWNRVYNLTSVPGGSMTISHHLLDSLAIAPMLDGETVLDIGSGAGFPGIPLAICLPHRQFTLLDSVGKKTRFLEHVRIKLGLANLRVVQSRAEDFEGRYDVVMCRGLASLAGIARMAAHLLAKSGRLLALKGTIDDAEANDVALPFIIERIHSLAVPGVQGQRNLVVMKME
jgi:16S rRNA (guanine527-N7)-methyltransferase